MSRHGAIEEQAANWLVRREQPEWSVADEEGLGRWLETSHAHQAAFWRLDAGWRAAERLAAVQIPAHRRLLSSFSLRRGISPLMALAASLLIVLAISFLAARHLAGSGGAIETVASTPVGGREDLALNDGSRVTLNTATALHAAIGGRERRLWLDRGEAYFQIFHDRKRPFVIYAGNRKVTVLGTKFSVRRDGEKLTVVVTEGRVRIDNAGEQNESAAIVPAGHIAIAQGQSLLVADRSERRMEDALTWRYGMLTFDQVTLAEAAREFNRYNIRQIRFGDDRAAQIRIGGSFNAKNVDAFAHLLQEAFGLHVVSSGNTITINS